VSQQEQAAWQLTIFNYIGALLKALLNFQQGTGSSKAKSRQYK
jgi:hypothetical protein